MADYARYKKQPAEKLYVGFDIKPDRPTDSSETIVVGSSSVTVKVVGGADTSAAMIETSSTTTDATETILQARLIAGDLGKKYWIEFRAETTAGNKYEKDVFLTIFDPAA